MSLNINGQGNGLNTLQHLQALRAAQNKNKQIQQPSTSLQNPQDNTLASTLLETLDATQVNVTPGNRPNPKVVSNNSPSQDFKTSSNSNASRVPPPVQSEWEKGIPFQEIKNIAERAGYVGISNRDIKEAYVRGESLLADYRV
ncbi:MAG: hypothetical protein K2X66_13475 [Cyanobacteria bacterium]|nr:hypothetical protein [Cyanobacteriota bacterium]